MTRIQTIVLGSAAALFALALAPMGLEPNETPDAPKVVLGVFDSRAIAVAYIRSEAFSEYLSAQQTDIGKALARAKAAGDDELVAELEELGPAMQRRIRRQGFGTAAVDDIIARIEDELPGIAEEAGVDVIVSKWTLAYHSQAAKLVDVTDLLAAQFDPDEATWKIIQQTVRNEPIPLDQLEDHED